MALCFRAKYGPSLASACNTYKCLAVFKIGYFSGAQRTLDLASGAVSAYHNVVMNFPQLVLYGEQL